MVLPIVLETIEEQDIHGHIFVTSDDEETGELVLYDVVEVRAQAVTPIRGADYPILAQIWENDADDIFDDDALPSG